MYVWTLGGDGDGMGSLTVWATEMRSQPTEVVFRALEGVERDILCSVVLVWFGF
jgi:hypothetical protein